MNCTSVLTGVLRRGIKPVFATSSGLFAQSSRNAFILQRQKRMPLMKKGCTAGKLRQRYMIYDLVENTETSKKLDPIDIILTEYIPGVGSKGEKISVPPIFGYNKYLLPGLAVYASPDNLIRYEKIIASAKSDIPEYSSPWVPRTINVLSRHLLDVTVNQNKPWTLQKFHIRAAFRKNNIHVPDEAITMPEREISGPDLEKEDKEFYITVTINKREQVKVRGRIHHYTNKESEKIPLTEFWLKPADPIFPEDQPILDSMPRHALCEDPNAASTV